MQYQRPIFIGFKGQFFEGHHSLFKAQKDLEATHHVVTTLSTIILPLVDAMLYKAKNSSFRGEGCLNGFAKMNQMEDHIIGQKMNCEPISLLKVSAIHTNNL